jgi:hypothetical protein
VDGVKDREKRKEASKQARKQKKKKKCMTATSEAKKTPKRLLFQGRGVALQITKGGMN